MRSTFKILKDTFTKIFSNSGTFLSIIALPALIAAAATFFEPGFDTSGEYIWKGGAHMAQYILIMFVFTIASILMTIAATIVAENNLVQVADAYKMAFEKLAKYIVMAIISSIVIMLGFICLILPGVWLAISLTFATYYLILRGTGARESLKMSFALVKGRWWSVFGKSLLFGIFYLLCAIPVYILLGIVGSFIGETVSYLLESTLSVFGSLVIVVFMYELFTDLEKTKVASVVPPEPVQPVPVAQ
jgi:uncharacterized membrane protein